MNKLKKENEMNSLEEFVSETQQQLLEIYLNIKDPTKIYNLQTEESVSLIEKIIEIVARHAFEIGCASCAEHIRENLSNNQLEMQVLDNLPILNDVLNYLNEYLDFNLKHIIKDIINEQVLDEDTSISDKYYLKFFLLKSCESSLNHTLTELTAVDNKCSLNPDPKVNIDFSKFKGYKVK